MTNKKCKICSYKLQKRGKTAAGTQRYFCPHCHRYCVRKRVDLAVRNHFKLYLDWQVGKPSLQEIANNHKTTRQTLNKWFKPFRNQEIVPIHVSCQQQVIIIDGYGFTHCSCVALIVQLNTGKIVTWKFAQVECFSCWMETLNQVQEFPFAVVGDGQKGMLKAIKQRWPGVIIQRCQFHVIYYVRTKLTQHPESQASQELSIEILLNLLLWHKLPPFAISPCRPN